MRGLICPCAAALSPKLSRTVTRSELEVKQAGRPDSVTVFHIAMSDYDNHSSRRRIAPPLKLSTRTLREPHQRVPI